MRCDPEKIKALRAERSMTQEKLAQMSNVQRRTVQRAEAGAALSLETVADLAAALSVPTDELRARAAEEIPDETDWITARRVESGRMLLETLRSARLASLEYQLEPTAENLPLLKQVIGTLEQHMPLDPWDRGIFSAPSLSLVDDLESIVTFNQQLQDLRKAGLALFLGKHFEAAVMPRFNADEGFFYTSPNHAPEYIWIARLVLASTGAEKLKVSRHRDWPVQLTGDLDGEIPF